MEKNLALSFARIVGQPTASKWSQVFSLTKNPLGLTPQSTLNSKAFGVISLETFGDDGAAEAGSQIITFLQHTWEAEKLPISDKLYSTLKQLKQQQAVHLTLTILLVEVDLEQITLAGIGNIQAILSRNNKQVEIFSTTTNLNVVQGKWKPEDQLLIGTTGLIQNMSPKLLEEVLFTSKLDEVEEELAVIVRTDDHSELVAGLVVHFQLSGSSPSTTPKKTKFHLSSVKEILQSRIYSRFNLKPPSVYLRQQKKPRKVAISVGLVILIMLAGSMWLGWQQRQKQFWLDRYQTAYDTAEGYANAAEILVDKNPLESKRLYNLAKQSLEESLPTLSEKPVLKERLEQYYQTISQKYLTVSGQNIITNLQPWYDTTLIRDNFFGNLLSLTDDILFVLDQKLGLVAGMNINTKQGELVGGGLELAGAKYFDTQNNQALVLANGGIVELSTTQKTTSIVQPPEPEWGNIKSVNLFGTNIYLLDIKSNQIWKYARQGKTLSPKQAWFNPGTNYVISGIQDMAINGNIWLLDNTGEVWKLEQGGRRDFTINDLDLPLKEPVALDTLEEGDFIIVLDPINERLVTISKDGSYLKQYVSPVLKQASDLVLNSDGKAVFVLSGSTIFKIDL